MTYAFLGFILRTLNKDHSTMCGIIGYIGNKRASDILLTGLKRMEYRGYDSAGIATHEKFGVRVSKKQGLVVNLENEVKQNPHLGTIGIGHTRWATHGAPTDQNAHPHKQGKTTIIHNGIVENYEELKGKLVSQGYVFVSETDTEVLAALIDAEYIQTNDPTKAVSSALKQMRGTFGLCVLFDGLTDTIVVARRSSPVLIAQDAGSIYIASDQNALAGKAKSAIILGDDEIALCRPGSVDITSLSNTVKGQQTLIITADEKNISKDGFDHFMQKEIHEQPESIKRVLSGRLFTARGSSQLGGINLTPKQLRGIRSLLFVACGTAYHAGLTAKYILEPLIGIPIQVETASELRYRNVALTGSELAIAISQSGETADTIACIDELQLKGIPVLGIVNVIGSTIARMVDGGVYTHAGPEISVASTKAFTSQVVALLLVGLYMARQRDLTPAAGMSFLSNLEDLERIITEVIALESIIKKESKRFSRLPHLMTLGRDTLYPIALEIALKIKEISYIPTSGYPAGEMKHGANALLGNNMGVIYLLGAGDLQEKALSNLAEVHARDAQTLVLTDIEGYQSDHCIHLPKSSRTTQPIIFAVAGQLLAYHIAREVGTEIDKPRNLAKSVTVE
jgi:glucosamine--fructose-6-phosphate aminotransferase (isomerizing)